MLAIRPVIATSDVISYRLMEFSFMCFAAVLLIFSAFLGAVKAGIVFVTDYLIPFNRQAETGGINHIIRDAGHGLFKNIFTTAIRYRQDGCLGKRILTLMKGNR